MIKDITLGQYFPGNTFVHRLDPRTKLVLTLVYIVALFVAKDFISYSLMIAFLICAIAASRIKLRVMMKGLRPLILIITITAVLNLFYTKGEVLWSLWTISVTKEGLHRAVLMILRITMLVMGTFLLTYTTAPISLTDGLEKLLNPLKKIRVPVHEISMMMSIALRFIPTLIEETGKIMNAQKARGAQLDTGGLIKKVRAMVPILVPLFVSAFRRADELAVAMECRCYHGGEGRTRLKQLRLERRDVMAFGVAALVLAGVVTLAVFGM